MCQLDHMHPTDQKLISAALTLRAKEQDEGFIVAMAMLGQCFVLVWFFFYQFCSNLAHTHRRWSPEPNSEVESAAH